MTRPASFADIADDALLDVVLSRLNVDYWYDVDHNFGRTAYTFFVKQGASYTIQDAVFSGQGEIRDFYAWREGRGDRVARHCVVNMRALAVSPDRATATSILLLYAADGRPILPTAAPIQIADVHDVCVREGGEWRYESRRLVTLFAGGAPITLPPDEPLGRGGQSRDAS